jgi:murein L,D-transpeptidase YcbB/YkuD
MSKKKIKKVELTKKQGFAILAVSAVVLAGIVAVSFMSFAGTCKVGKTDGCPTIRKGSTNKKAVTVLQTELKTICYWNPALDRVDGKFGTRTYDLVKVYQKDRKLKSDGIVGKNTWKALKKDYATLRGGCD